MMKTQGQTSHPFELQFIDEFYDDQAISQSFMGGPLWMISILIGVISLKCIFIAGWEGALEDPSLFHIASDHFPIDMVIPNATKN